MFMGSRNAPYPAFDAIMESWGGHNNGTTSNDRTNYYEIGPRNLLETFLWLEADRLATLPDVITDEELERQLKVVQNERRQSYENRPYGRAELRGPGGDVPAGPPVPLADHRIARRSRGRDRRGRPRVLRAVLPAVERQPGRRRRLRSGRGAPAGRSVLRLAAEAAAARRARRKPATPRLERDVDIALTDRVQLPRLRLTWHSPALFASGDADLDMAAHVLGGGKSSRLYKSLVFDKRIAQDVFAYQGSQMLGSLFQVGATAKPGHDLDELAAAIAVEMDRLAAEGPTEAELARARNTHLADFYKSLDHLQTRADLLNHYQHVLGDPGGVARDVARYQQTTIASVRDAFARVAATRHLDLRISPEPAAASDAPVTA